MMRLVLAFALLLAAAPAAAQTGYSIRWTPGTGELPDESCARYDVDSFGSVSSAVLGNEFLELSTGESAGFLYSQTTPRFVLTDPIAVDAHVRVASGEAVLAVADGLTYLELRITPKFVFIGRNALPTNSADGTHRFRLEWDRAGSRALVKVEGLAFSTPVAPSLFLVGEAWEGLRWGNGPDTVSQWSLVAHESGSAPCTPFVAVEAHSWGTLKHTFGRD